MKSVSLHCLLFILVGSIAVAQTSPVPLVYQPLIPMTVKPGSTGFTLTLNGIGFSSRAAVYWNGSTRVTTVISSTQVQAVITAADVAKPGTALVAVVNPGPGGGTSNVVFFPVQTPTPSTVVFPVNFSSSGVIAVADFNSDAILDLAVGTNSSIDIYLGNGDGTFQTPFSNHSVTPVTAMLAGDFDGNGKPDLVVLDGIGNTTVFTNRGKSIFLQQQVFRSATASPNYPVDLVTADFNGDGKLDLVVTGFKNSALYLGNGDGTFGAPLRISVGTELGTPAVGDFNGDGKLDLALPSGGVIHVLLGNGDGTFQPDVTYGAEGFSAVAADVNGDGKLDIVTNGVSVLLGNGDGTFTSDGGVPLSSISTAPVNIADFNGDGKLDLAIISPSGIALLLGNGDGTFQAPTIVAAEQPATLGMGDFNNDGKLDLVGLSLYLQSPINVSPGSLNFGNQKVGTKSNPQTVTVINDGSSALNITDVHLAGNDPNDFSQTNNCGSLPVGAQCQISVIFQPAAGGPRSASLSISYPGLGSPQIVSLSGFGAVATVTLTPAQLKFQTQLVGTTSSARAATLTNTGTVTVNISNISTTGPFSETNNCPSALVVNASCQIQVKFAPQRRGLLTGQLSVTDDANGSPQQVALSGIGTVVKLSALGLNLGDQKVGTKSAPAPVKLTNVGPGSLAIHGIAIKGANAGDFSETNDCGNSVPAGGSCTINVTFAPQAKGKRSANLQISDNGGGSPQRVALSGKGT